MAYRMGQRHQLKMFPEKIEDYVDADDPARVYDAFVDSLNFEEIKLRLDYKKEGNPQYDPKSMLKVLLYGYSYGIRSSRKLERALKHNITFIWRIII